MRASCTLLGVLVGILLFSGCADRDAPGAMGPDVSPAAASTKGKPPPSGGGGVSGIALSGLSKRGSSEARDVNDAGVIVGWAVDAGGVGRPVRWSPQGTGWGSVQQLSSPTGGGGASAINSDGFVVGQVSSGAGQPTAAIWRPDGSRVDLAPGFAYDINASKTVVGWSSDLGPVAWRYSASSGTWTLDALPTGGATAWVNGIGDGDLAVGGRQVGAGEQAVFWSRQGGVWVGPTPLGATGLAGSWGNRAGPAGAGGIAGGVWAPGPCGSAGNATAAVWASTSAQPTTLPGIGGAQSSGNDINRFGEVVGRRLATCTGGTRGFWWSPTQGALVLEPPGASGVSEALAVNAARVAVGSASQRAVAWRIP